MKIIVENNNYKRIIRNASFLMLSLCVINGCRDDDDEPNHNTVTITALDPTSPASLTFEERVTISFNYEITEPDGARIWIMPYTDGAISPSYVYTSSPLFTGTGSRNVTIGITSGDSDILVDQLKIKIADATGDNTISETFEPVEYTFGP